MDRKSYMLAVLSSIQDSIYTPVQIQKIFFLLDRNLGNRIGGPYFNFEPYHYGPFDKNVYKEVESLVMGEELTEHTSSKNYKTYSLTQVGFKKGLTANIQIGESEKKYIQEICLFVKSLSFEQLLRSIYNEYPEMKVNSVFQP
jgi:hypothetical protein